MPEKFARSTAKRRRHVTVFAIVFGALLALAYVFGTSAGDLRRAAITERQWGPNEAMVYTSLDRRHFILLRLGLLERRAAPAILAVGGHEIKFFSSQAFGSDTPPGYFFNAWQGNLSLRESRDLLVYLETIGKLPTELILVSVPSPHFALGNHIVDYEADLPFDVAAPGLFEHEPAGVVARVLAMYGSAFLERTFNYSAFLVGLFRPERYLRIIDISACADALQRAAARPSGGIEALARRTLPRTIQAAIKIIDDAAYCSEDVLLEAMRSDGSTFVRIPGLLERPVPPPRPAPAAGEEWMFRPGHEDDFARAVGQIRAIARRNGLKVAFFVQPVYERPETASIHDLFDRAVRRAGGEDILDHRRLIFAPESYVDYRHPTGPYYRRLARDLRERGLLSR